MQQTSLGRNRCYPGAPSPLTVTNRLLSPRRTWSVRVVLRSSCPRSLLNCSVDLTSVVWPLLVTAVITSPARTSARRLLRTSSTITPPPSFRSRFCSAVRSTTTKPRRLAACSGGFPRRSLRLATRSSGSSPTVTVISRVAPLRHSSIGALIPGLVLPTIRGNSFELDTDLPSNLRMMSPVATPAFSAGPPFSPPFTNAPPGLGRPHHSPRSLH